MVTQPGRVGLTINQEVSLAMNAEADLFEEEFQAFALASVLRQDVQVCASTVYHFGCDSCSQHKTCGKVRCQQGLTVSKDCVFDC